MAAPAVLQELGGTWFNEGRAALLRVPSAIVSQEYNFLLNPLHADASQIDIADPETFGIDYRRRHPGSGVH